MLRLFILFVMLIGLGAAALFFDDWWPLAVSVSQDYGQTIQTWGVIAQWIVSITAFAFLVLFGRSVRDLFRHRPPVTPVAAPATKPPPTAPLTAYYTGLRHTCQRLNLELIDPRFGEYYRATKITLPGLYRDMEVTPCSRQRDENAPEALRLEEAQRQPLLSEAAQDENKRLLIEGDVGSGKSMFVDYLAGQIAASHLGPSPNTLPPVFRHEPVIRLRLRTIALQLGECKDPDRFLLQAMHDQFEKLAEQTVPDPAWKTIEDPLLQHGIILLDGLDEVPATDGRRATLFNAVERLRERLGRDARLIVTSRPYVFDDRHRLPGFECQVLQPMRNPQIQGFLGHWYRLMRANRNWSEEQAQEQATTLYRQLLERDYLLDLARQPLLLTLLTSLHFARNVLPHSRAELYQQAIDLMLERWTQRALQENRDYPLEPFERKALAQAPETRLAMLRKVALDANNKNTLEIATDRITRLFGEHLGPDCNAGNLLDFLRYRSGILKPGTGDHLEFYHRSFQDYLAATALTDLTDWQDEMERLLQADHGLEWWSEVFLLLVSVKIYGNSKPDAVALMHRFARCPAQPDSGQGRRWPLLFLVARALNEHKPQLLDYYRTNDHYRALVDEVERQLLDLVTGRYDQPVDIRARAGRRLGELGDPRPGVTVVRDGQDQPVHIETEGRRHRLPDIDWVALPGGRYTMGSDPADEQAFDWEKPPHPVAVAPFRISRYPITNAQYACFVEAGGYERERYWLTPRSALNWWQGTPGQADDLNLLEDNPKWKKEFERWTAQETTRRQPRFWDERRWNIPNHPVVGISWYEALAFCHWLGDCLNHPSVPAERRIAGIPRLPSEAEWEYAARGTSGLRYAWGDEADPSQGNYDDTGLGRTSAVGLFPPGRAFEAPRQLYDLSGNVWEWTRSRWGTSLNSPDFGYDNWASREAERDQLKPVELRVVRGGSWGGSSVSVRCAMRYGLHPADRYNFVGFRVVFSLAADS